jgi:uncharacterized protein (UPF0335 family)
MSDVNLKLKKIVESIEKLEDEKKELSRQISDVLKEAKAFGFNTVAIKKIISIRKADPNERAELEQLIETYKDALGMIL